MLQVDVNSTRDDLNVNDHLPVICVFNIKNCPFKDVHNSILAANYEKYCDLYERSERAK